MKYLVFAGPQYYPTGGWSDFKGDFDSKEDALVFLTKHHYDWWEIVEIVSLISCDGTQWSYKLVKRG